MKLRLLNIKYYLYCMIYGMFFKQPEIFSDNRLNQYGKLIVSLTTKPGRIHKLWMVIESILRQDKKPDAVILYLAKDEFKDESVLPSALLKLKKRGLQIVFIGENLRPHNKYFYAMSSFPYADILTIDDDKIYPSDLIKVLTNGRVEYPNEICSVRARNINIDGGTIGKYDKWKIVCEPGLPSHALLGLGVCGVLYPSGALHQDVFDVKQLKKSALLADDLWIKIMALKNDTRVVSLGHLIKKPFLAITGLKSENLMTQNVWEGKNDLIFNALVEHYQVDVRQFLG